MVRAAPIERRRHPRKATQAAARLIHLASRRAFPCRLADTSAAGAQLTVPPTAPVNVGHEIQIEPEGFTGLSDGARAIAATITRIDRSNLLTQGNITIGVEFHV